MPIGEGSDGGRGVMSLGVVGMVLTAGGQGQA